MTIWRSGDSVKRRESFIVWDARLVEEAVLRAIETRPADERRAFHRERDPIYDHRDADERERHFQTVHARWFERLRLDAPVLDALAEQAAVADAVIACHIAPAPSRRAEAADLFHDATGRLLVVRLMPASLLEPHAVVRLLRHELMHVTDMLDPAFGYERELPISAIGPSYDNLLRDRYRVLWDTTIEGRLSRLGRAPSDVRSVRFAEFARTFAMLGDRVAEEFARWFDEARPTHRAFVAFIQAPGGLDAAGSLASGRCPICRFPTARLEGEADRLPREVRRALQAEFPAWRPAQGLCRQCADLYEARAAGLNR